MNIGDKIKIEDMLYYVERVDPLKIAPLTDAPSQYDYEIRVAPEERRPNSNVFWVGNEKVAEIYGKNGLEFNCNCGLSGMTTETALAFAEWVTRKLQ